MLRSDAAEKIKIEDWLPPNCTPKTRGLNGGEDNDAKSYFTSTSSFTEVWTFYANKLGIKGPPTPGHSGGGGGGVNRSTSNYGDPPNETASTLVRSDQFKHVIVTLYRRTDAPEIDVFLVVLPR